MARGRIKKNETINLNISDYRYDTTRKNNPPAKIAGEGRVPDVPKIQYNYSPRLDPVLRSDPSGKADRLPELLEAARQRPLTEEETRVLAAALRKEEPWLEWAGKREAKRFTVDPVALNIHERVSAQAILKVASRQDVNRDLFADPKQDYRQAVQFYQHDIDWTNRLILGDNLQVMASLAHREDLASKVQMIYIDPPYGIKFGSNFQSEVGKRDVKDKESDLIREPEMVKAYRDTWTLGVHSYLAYLRDRFYVAKDLLADTGSIFVQIGEENLHLVRNLMDEVFRSESFCRVIPYVTTSYQADNVLGNVVNYLLWYAKDKSRVTEKIHTLFRDKSIGEAEAKEYKWIMMPSGECRAMTEDEFVGITPIPKNARVWRHGPLTSQGHSETGSKPITFRGKTFSCGSNQHWKTNKAGIERMARADHLIDRANSISTFMFLDHFSVTPINNLWMDTKWGFDASDKAYVVQTNTKIIERCLLMTTDPGDLVLDPTCGSGTTAYVAEQWGRRWITTDTSRVALAIARQRLMTSKFDYYECKDNFKGVTSGFHYKTVPHITLKSIAQNTNLDPIIAKHEPILKARLDNLNVELMAVSDQVRQKLATKLLIKQKTEGKRSVTDADIRRWKLPKKGERFEHWTVPFDADIDYPKAFTEAVTAYRSAWSAKIVEVNACIDANAEQEELVDQPLVKKGVVRVTGPFTVEAVQPPEISLGGNTEASPIAGEPEELETGFIANDDGDIQVKNVEAYLDQMLRLLKLDGV